MTIAAETIQRGLLTFWGLFFTIVFLTNLCDGLKEAEVLGSTWRFASGNYRLMQLAVSRYEFPNIVTAVLFSAATLWEGLVAASFWRAAGGLATASRRSRSSVAAAFGSALALMAAFVLADEIFLAYELEAGHLHLFTAQLVSLIFCEMVSGQLAAQVKACGNIANA